METENYTVKTLVFEGPLALLFNLVLERKLFINEVSLDAVTEDYLKYVSLAGNIPSGEVASFMVVAATLILIKSKSLLPSLDISTEEESDIRNLEERLRLYEIFIRAAEGVRNNFSKKIIFAPLPRRNNILVFLPDAQITPERMMILAKGVLGNLPLKAILPEVEVKKVISIEEMIGRLTERIQNTINLSFKDFSRQRTGELNREEKIEMIVGFLAILELVRQGIIHAVQENDSADIIIQHRQLQYELGE